MIMQLDSNNETNLDDQNTDELVNLMRLVNIGTDAADAITNVNEYIKYVNVTVSVSVWVFVNVI